MDGAMTKSPLGGKTGPNPTDRGKTGVKRSLLSEAQGIPVGLAAAGANRHDTKLVRATVDSLPVPRPAPSPDPDPKSPISSPSLRPHPKLQRSRPCPSLGLCLDQGYDSHEVGQTLHEFGFTAHIRPEAKTCSTGPAKPHLYPPRGDPAVLGRGEEARQLQSPALGGGTDSRMNRLQRILVRRDKSPDNYTPFFISPVPLSLSERLEVGCELISTTRETGRCQAPPCCVASLDSRGY